MSGKTGAKKGGMRGGTLIIYRKSPDFPYGELPYIEIETDASLRHFNALKIIFDTDKMHVNSPDFNRDYYDNLLVNLEHQIPNPSRDNKKITFTFREDISEELIERFLKDEKHKKRILDELKKLDIKNNVKIYLYIPYLDDEKSTISYIRKLYLEYPTYHNSARANSAPANLAQANPAAQNNVSGFIYEKIETLEELEKLLEFVEKFNFKGDNGDVNINKPIRKTFRTDDVYQNLKVVIKARILKLDMNKFPNIKTKQFIINMHGKYIPFIIRDTSGKIISVGATHERPLSINDEDYLELHLILAVPGSNKGTGKKSMKLLFDNLPPEYSGIALEPLQGVERFYMKLGYKPYRGGYYFKTKPSE